MKILAAFLLLSSLSHAANYKGGELDFICRSEARPGVKTITQIRLKQIKPGPIEEGVKIPFLLQVENLNAKTRDVVGVPAVYRGNLETEDVQVFFNSFDKKVYYSMFLDELEESTLEIQGQKAVRLICEEHRW